MHGGLVQGIAQALCEEAVYDDARHPGHRVVRRLHPADVGRHDLRSSPTAPSRRRRRTTLGVKGVGEAGTHRLDARRSSTPSSTRCDRSASTTSRCRARPSGSGRPSSRPGRTGDAATGDGQPHFDAARPTRTHHTQRRSKDGAGHDPRSVRLRRPDVGRRRPWRRSPRPATTPRCMAGGQSLLPVLRLRLNAPEQVVDLGRIEELRGVARGRRRTRHRRDDHAADVLASDLGPPSTRALLAKAIADGRRPADPAPRHVRRRAGPRRPGRRPAARRRWRSTPSSSSPGRGGERTVAAADFFEDLFETAVGEDELLTADPDPEAHRLGRALREVRPGRAPVVDRRRRGGRAGRRRHDRRGADRADQHGLHAAARDRGRGRPSSGSRRPTRRSATACAAAADGTNPPSRPQRRRRLPQAPRDGADPTRGPRRGRRLSPWS